METIEKIYPLIIILIIVIIAFLTDGFDFVRDDDNSIGDP